MRALSRRGFLTQTVGAAWAGATILEAATLRAAGARAMARQALSDLFDIEKVADGVWGAMAHGRALINSNSVIVELSDGVLIVDSQASPSAVGALVAQIRRSITSKPVRYVVLTHMHGDHTQGLPEHRRLSPDVQVMSSAFTRAQLAASGTSRLKGATDGARRSIETYSQRASAATASTERAYWQEMADEARAFVSETDALSADVPDVEVDGQVTLHDRAQDVRIFFDGRGHTAGDLFVYIPEKKVMATGDMFHSFFPSMGDCYPGEWQATLRKVAMLPFNVAIGGHGGLQRAPVRIDDWCAYLDELGEIVTRARADGTPLDRLTQTVTPDTLKSLASHRYGEFLLGQMKHYDFRIQTNTDAEVAARYVRDNLTAVFRNLGRA